MPDIDFQKIELNLIPKKGDEPVIFYASQYETARPFIADLKWGTTEFAPGDDCYAEIDIRKNDNNLVVITDDVAIDNNEVSVILPVQALTCIGKNLGQVKIYSADDHLIAALNFLLEVQPDPLAGGVDSETAIDNLTTQIESIAEEVIGENYYDKTEVDNLLADKADVSDLPDMTQYYTKTQTDTLLNGKADASTTYTKTEVDNALALKANISDLATVATTGDYDDLINKPSIPAAQIQSDYAQADNTQVDYIKNKPDIAGMIAAVIFDILPVGTASGNPCSFDTAIAAPLQGLTAEITASGGGGTPSTPIPIVGHSELNLVRCGVNQFDEQTETGYYDSTTGEKKPLASEIRSTNLVPVFPNTTYAKVGLSAGYSFVFFDSAKNFLSRYTSGGSTFTTPANCYYIGINFGANYGNTYNNDVSINYPSTDTSYHAYNGDTFTVQFGQTVYGGVYDANRGKVKPNVYYPSYNGETINGRWLSSKDVYVEGNTPTTGAQVVCLDEYDTEIDVSELSVAAIVGANNITSDGGGDVTVSYKDSIQHYIDNQ